MINSFNYNDMINKPDIDPYNNDKKLDAFSYILKKYHCYSKSVTGIH